MAHLFDKYKTRFRYYYEGVEPINHKHEEVNKLKYYHTFRVVNEITKLCEYLSLGMDDVFLAQTIALFHDVGRFEQYARYQTFSDKDSVDHAELAITIINENGLMDGVGEADSALIKKAIINHNKLAVSNGLNQRELFFTKLIRDADKLDILYVVTNNKKYFVPDDQKNNGTEINPVFVDNIKNYQLVSYDDVKGMLDYIVLRASWIFDMNFDYSVQQFRERNYLDRLLEQLPDSVQKNEIQSALENFIRSQINKD